MTKLWPEFDAFIEDLTNIWQGDSIENVINTDLSNPDSYVDSLEDDFKRDLAADLGVLEDELKDLTTEMIEFVAAGIEDFGFGSKSQVDNWGWWPLSIPLTLAAIATMVVISR